MNYSCHAKNQKCDALHSSEVTWSGRQKLKNFDGIDMIRNNCIKEAAYLIDNRKYLFEKIYVYASEEV